MNARKFRLKIVALHQERGGAMAPFVVRVALVQHPFKIISLLPLVALFDKLGEDRALLAISIRGL